MPPQSGPKRRCPRVQASVSPMSPGGPWRRRSSSTNRGRLRRVTGGGPREAVTLTDAGPLIAIIDADEEDHVACMEALDQIVIPLVTTWPAFTEAMHLLARAGGIRAQQALWRLVQTDRLVIADLSPSAVDRSARLMDQYADRPMDLADATIVALAEEQGDRRIFTLDADFQIYRFRGRQRFETIPAR